MYYVNMRSGYMKCMLAALYHQGPFLPGEKSPPFIAKNVPTWIQRLLDIFFKIFPVAFYHLAEFY